MTVIAVGTVIAGTTAVTAVEPRSCLRNRARASLGWQHSVSFLNPGGVLLCHVEYCQRIPRRLDPYVW